ncbi:hypothetical protein MGG_15653 [Pyricularia oryzae 70-15]|uniref:Uncharacterized protein n=1 Tax=Pyricularia oryzae (strain 70-15 / ATCC MYA-4617 / FGSC 8958) TaxID=242507 RepID=G4MXL3_PYRO7|nr:uncharacterized protein MGG_15653 [Pyricularia oryzae 70-15]EHA54344.1 hypothetical protein MGG_15653 [Pyricularia oryzae 70-15]
MSQNRIPPPLFRDLLTPGPYLVTTDRRLLSVLSLPDYFSATKKNPIKALIMERGPIDQSSSHQSSHFIKQHADF